MNKISFEEYLSENETLTYRNTGSSMMPLLKEGRDLFTVRRLEEDESPKVEDVVLFRRKGTDGEMKYVLHRMICDHGKTFDFLGDNCINPEKNVPREDVLGIMTEYVRKGKTYKVTDRAFLRYSFRIRVFRRPRIFYKKCRFKLAKIFRKLFPRK